MKTYFGKLAIVITLLGFLAQNIFAAGNSEAHGFEPWILAGIAVILLSSKFLGQFFERLGQPAVLGELFAGIILGNLFLFGFDAAESLKTNEVIGSLAQIGVIILLFEIGLETNLKEMREVGLVALSVASIGVIAPFLFGWLATSYFLPNQSILAHIFIGLILSATSIGITARVLKDLGKITSPEARIILGAAVIDDVIGMVILAIISSAIQSSTNGTAMTPPEIAWIAIKAVLFLLIAIVFGQFFVPKFFRSVRGFESPGLVLALSISFCFLLGWASAKVGLAPIIGAFAAGLILEEAHFEHFIDHKLHDLQEFLVPLTKVFAPIFFVVVGLKVDLRAFGKLELLGFAAVLTVAAIAGKVLCSLAVFKKHLNRLAIGMGMVPRGEVALIFAGIGSTLMLPNAQNVLEPIVTSTTFGAIVIMIFTTTLLTPTALKWALDRKTNEVAD